MGLLLGFTVAGCAAPNEGAEGVETELTAEAEGASSVRDVSTVPAYFDYDNRYAVSDEDSWIYARFNSHVGKRITVDVHQQPGAEDAAVGFKLYRIQANGRLRLVRQVDGASGSASYVFRSSGTGSYLVEMVSSGHLADLELGLSCRGGSCSPDAQPNELCGVRGASSCAEGLYCAFDAGAACGASDQGGVCAKRPEMCIQIYNPVCGCDGHTYGNACTAASAGVSVKSVGECEQPVAQVGESCGGFRRGPSPVCAEGLYCNYTLGDACGRADAPGTCAERPEACTREYAPVCGCDGETYPNACVAASQGVALDRRGACDSPVQD